MKEGMGRGWGERREGGSEGGNGERMGRGERGRE